MKLVRDSFHKRLSWFWHRLLSMSPKNAAVLSTAVFLLVALVDYLTPPEFNLTFAYVFVILLAAWTADLRVAFTFVLLALGMQLVVMSGIRSHFSSSFPYYLALGNRLFTFLVVLAFAIPLKRMYAHERLIARIDSLTGIPNRQAFREALNSEIARFERKAFPFSVAYIDVDNFKVVNDQAGHQQGDRVLIAIGQAIRKTIRKTDLVARIGGDEFAVLFPHCDWDVTAQVLKRVQKQLGEYVSQHQWPSTHLPLTLSIGLGTFDTPVQTPDVVMSFCDSLMYQVKRNNKDDIACQRFSKEAANSSGLDVANGR